MTSRTPADGLAVTAPASMPAATDRTTALARSTPIDERHGPGAAAQKPDGTPADAGGLVTPDVKMSGRRIMLAPHNCFACGQLNVHGLRIDLHVDAGRCWTELVLAERFEGWEGIAHGGILCTLLDEVMAWALIDHDSWGVTARMAVDFKRPVRIGVPIRAEGWIVRARRRLLETAGRIVDPETGVELAAATATYMAASEEKKRELKARYRFEISSESSPSRGGAAS